MSLLLLDGQSRACKIADDIHESEFTRPDQPAGAKGPEGDTLPMDGLIQTIILLDISVRLDDEDFFRWTAVWTFTLLSTRMGDDTGERTRGFIIRFCQIIERHLMWFETQEERDRAKRMLDAAIRTLQTVSPSDAQRSFIEGSSFQDIEQRYLQSLLSRDVTGAMKLVLSTLETVPLYEVYTQIIQDVMYEVGELWLQNRITVAQEHYCTAATQTIMASLYPRLFSHPKSGRKVVVACVGSELHELGARMVSDLFEDAGWDSIFLGAATPEDALLQTLDAEKPDLCALSVSLQQGVSECATMVHGVKERFPQIPVAVGGHAFMEMTKAEPYIGADIFTNDVAALISWAEATC